MKLNRCRAATLAAAVILASLLPACAPRVSTPQVDDSDYVFPDIKRGEMTSRDEKSLRRAWDDILIGQTARAEQAVNKLMVSRPGLAPSTSRLRLWAPCEAPAVSFVARAKTPEGYSARRRRRWDGRPAWGSSIRISTQVDALGR